MKLVENFPPLTDLLFHIRVRRYDGEVKNAGRRYISRAPSHADT